MFVLYIFLNELCTLRFVCLSSLQFSSSCILSHVHVLHNFTAHPTSQVEGDWVGGGGPESRAGTLQQGEKRGQELGLRSKSFPTLIIIALILCNGQSTEGQELEVKGSGSKKFRPKFELCNSFINNSKTYSQLSSHNYVKHWNFQER